jgi:hypothetical protein
MHRFSSRSGENAGLARRAAGAGRWLARSVDSAKTLPLCSARVSHLLPPTGRLRRPRGTRLRVAKHRQGGWFRRCSREFTHNPGQVFTALSSARLFLQTASGRNAAGPLTLKIKRVANAAAAAEYCKEFKARCCPDSENAISGELEPECRLDPRFPRLTSHRLSRHDPHPGTTR